jgi:hypothetical protein
LKTNAPQLNARIRFYVAGYCAYRHFAPMLASRENGENAYGAATGR